MVVSRQSIELAVRNIAHWGDTDVLPFPLENHWFYDAEDQVVKLLAGLDRSFDQWLTVYPVKFERCLSNVGHIGYRGVTQIDPIWNAYLLALVIEVGPNIEAARIPVEKAQVFSYRFLPGPKTYSLFDKDVGWGAFQQHAYKLSREFQYVLFADASDFYPRIYHHRLENALGHVAANRVLCGRIKTLLSKLSVGGVSYGLPVAGNAARLLSEIVLNRTDNLLNVKGIRFCRFVDDYYLFANTEEEARTHLVYLSDILLKHEGLSVNRGKTRLMTREEFSRTSFVADAAALESEEQTKVQGFFKLRLKFDPYSPTAEEEYDKLRSELAKFDVVGMLGREFGKTRVDEALTKQLVKSLKYLSLENQEAATESLISNLDMLYPIFPTVSLVVRALVPGLSAKVAALVFDRVRRLLHDDSHILQVPTNLAFALRLLADDPSEETDTALAQVYGKTDSTLVRRDTILCMAKRGVEYWLGDQIRNAGTTDLWLRRALLAGSFVLGDEGAHWRKRVKNELHRVDQEFMAWLKAKHTAGSWKVPL